MINDRMGRSVPAAPALLLLDSYAILTAILTHDCITSCRVHAAAKKTKKTTRRSLSGLLQHTPKLRIAPD
jgi:hypothetical protein